MPLLKPNSKNEIKRGEQKLKSIIGGKLVHNAEFIRLLKANNIKNTSKAWGRINSQIKQELENGMITYEEVEGRVHQLIVMESPNNRLITLEEANAVKTEETKRDILAKGKISIEIPYQSSGVGDVAIGTAVWGKSGAILGALNEGQTKWKYTELIFMDNGLNVKSTGNVVLYDDIKSIVLGNKGFVHTVVNILKHNGDGLICKVANIEVSAFKSIIEDHINNKQNIPSNNNVDKLNDNADVLLKYADLYERGLITREEFDLKKEQLLSSESNETSLLESENSQKADNILYCGNCGSPIDKESNFCTECGNPLK
ncbi:MAG: zinc-ribbon domain-containing protein [Methanobrevibacter sp.]|nr:zinc-ribbon domain-containing protein [Methanobrevibacter sp.]